MMKTVLSLFVTALLVPSLAAQPAAKVKANPKKEAVTSEDIKALRDALAAQSAMLATQQQQIQELRQELERRDQTSQEAQRQLEQTRAAATDAQTKAAILETATSNQTAAVAKLATDVADVRADVTKGTGSEKKIGGGFRFLRAHSGGSGLVATSGCAMTVSFRVAQPALTGIVPVSVFASDWKAS
jgi:TolA-binding protein